jgi:hypothetical protein
MIYNNYLHNSHPVYYFPVKSKNIQLFTQPHTQNYLVYKTRQPLRKMKENLFTSFITPTIIGPRKTANNRYKSVRLWPYRDVKRTLKRRELEQRLGACASGDQMGRCSAVVAEPRGTETSFPSLIFQRLNVC